MAKSHPHIEPIVNFFLDLFVIQTLGPGKQPDSAEALPVSGDSEGTQVFQFTVRGGGRKKHRRMTIQPIGEQVGSKSACYKVIYDDPLVIKIPPNPIADFSEYLKYIRQEHRIVNRLHPEVACVFPRLAAILKMVPFLRYPADESAEEIEDAYINQLTRRPGLQQYLKIENSFVFFMNLSRHLFFNQIIESMHSLRDRVKSDIIKNLPEGLEDPDAFEHLYGERNYRIYFEIRKIFSAYEESAAGLARKYEQDLFIPEYKWKEWFFSCLAGLKPDTGSSGVPKKLGRELQAQASRVMQIHRKSVENIYRTVHSRVRQKSFEANRARIKGIMTNVLELLCRLKERNLAIRDLKPDNMFIDRHLDAADHILADPKLYGFGLIDLETAVCFDPGRSPSQPLLAGTPAYATPSHLFPNSLLSSLYPGQLGRIFYLQDWYAAAGIMFNVITGRLLFTKTAKLMPEIMRAKRHGAKSATDYSAVYKNISGRFWQTAIDEFREKTETFAHRLSSLDLELPGHLKDFLKEAAAGEQKLITAEIKALIEKKPALKKHRQRILDSPHSAFVRILKKHRSGVSDASVSGDSTLKTMARIAELKYRHRHLDYAAKRLSGTVSARFLLSFIFDRAFYAMYRQDWSRKKPSLKGPCLERYRKSHSRI
ncbi:MAG: hypothetical protein ACOC0W_07080 [Desulfosalsimonas sp.]